MSLDGNKDSISIQDLDILLPNSQFHLNEATIWHTNKDSTEQLLDKSPVKLEITTSHICLKDFSAFAPILQNYTDQIQLSARVSGTINDLILEEFSLKQNGKISLLAKMNLKSITKPEETYVFGQVNNFHISADGLTDLINNFQNESIERPSYLTHLGSLDFNGEIAGFLDHLVAYGNLHSNIGSLKMDMLIGQKKENNIANYFKGQIASSELNIKKLFDEGNPYGIAHFMIDIDISRPINGSFSGNINAKINQFDYNEHRYENILLDGHFRKNEFNGMISINDANGQLYAEGLFKNSGKNSEFNFSANLLKFKPDKLLLTRKYDQPELNLSLNANFTGNNVDDFEGRIIVEDFSFLTSTDSFYLDRLRIETMGQELSRKLTLTSDILNAEIVGNYSFRSLLTSFSETAKIYLPSLPEIKQSQKYSHDNMFSLIVKMENTEKLSNTFKLPFTNLEQAQLTYQYNSILNQFNIEASLPKFKIGSSVFESGSILYNNPNGKMQLLTSLTLLHKKGARNQFSIQANAANDRIDTQINFENDQDNKMKISLQASSLFISEKDESGKEKFRTEITIEPEQIILKDSIWKLDPSLITIADGDINIDNFYLSKNDQYLRINGTASAKNPKETINLDLNDIELDYIFDIVNLPALQFGGRATGTVNLSDLYGNRILNTDLEVQNFSFNQVVQGRLNLFSEWDNDQQGILLLGTIYKNDTTWTDVNGYIYPVGQNAGISLYFDATDIDLALLNPYVDAFSHVVEGRGYGNIHLFGPFSKLSFEGKAFVREGRIGVEFLSTDYTFSDSIYIYPKSFEGKNITIQDKHGNKGLVSFNVNHEFLKNFTFNADIQAQNLLIYDTPERINPQLYGIVFGSGNAQVKGDEQLVDINANLQTDPQTFIGFNFMTGSTVEDYDFIIFKDQLKNKETSSNFSMPSLVKNNSETEIRFNSLIEATPNANFELIIDPAAGDKIKGNGSGNMQIQYGSKSNLSMYGAYTLLNGIYNFSLQQVIHKDFQIREGSRIDFSGDPMMANLNLDASYYLTANIEDLDQALVHETVRTSVPLNCILKLNGPLQNPLISFDLEFPSSSQELERQVKSFIDTEDMMLRQIIYLLVLNKFYTPDYSRNEYRSSELNSVASSALSSQLSGILNSLTDKVQIGANIRSGQEGFTDTEVEMLLSSQLLNNRLIFNGSFGYKNNMGESTKGNMVQSNAFIGEFDLEYKLTPSGEYRLKAYNHANDMYLYSKSLTRQGVGIMFRRDFTTLRELFQRRKRRSIILPADSTQSKQYTD